MNCKIKVENGYNVPKSTILKTLDMAVPSHNHDSYLCYNGTNTIQFIYFECNEKPNHLILSKNHMVIVDIK